MDLILSLLAFFGVTPDKYPILCLGVVLVFAMLLIGYVLYRKMSGIGDSIAENNNTLNKVKINIKAISTFLTTIHPGNFNPQIIESMSPFHIKEKGYKMLKDSGFEKIMDTPDSRSKILKCVSDQNPKTKLDVETQSILCYSLVLSEDFMNPIKTYLYNNPDDRDVFPTLAGVYIRDIYLKEHPEIIE